MGPTLLPVTRPGQSKLRGRILSFHALLKYCNQFVGGTWRLLVWGRLGAVDLSCWGSNPAKTTPRTRMKASPRDTALGDLRGGAHGLGLALLGCAGVELKQLILHGQLMPELRHLHRHGRGPGVQPRARTMPPPCSNT